MVCGFKTLTTRRLERIVQELRYAIVPQDGQRSLVCLVQEYHPQLVIVNAGLEDLKQQLDLMNADELCAPTIIAIGEKEQCSVAMFQMGVSDFLLSPVSKAELQDSLMRVCHITAAQAWILAQKHPNQQSDRQYLAARTSQGIELISLNDIYYLIAEQKYVKVRYKKGMLMLDETIKELEKEFGAQLCRIHRNALVNLHYLSRLQTLKFGQYQIHFRGVEDILAVSRRYLPSLRERMQKM